MTNSIPTLAADSLAAGPALPGAAATATLLEALAGVGVAPPTGPGALAQPAGLAFGQLLSVPAGDGPRTAGSDAVAGKSTGLKGESIPGMAGAPRNSGALGRASAPRPEPSREQLEAAAAILAPLWQALATALPPAPISSAEGAPGLAPVSAFARGMAPEITLQLGDRPAIRLAVPQGGQGTARPEQIMSAFAAEIASALRMQTSTGAPDAPPPGLSAGFADLRSQILRTGTDLPSGLTAGFAQSKSRILRAGLDLPPSAVPPVARDTQAAGVPIGFELEHAAVDALPRGLTAGFAQSNSRILRSGLDVPPSAAPQVVRDLQAADVSVALEPEHAAGNALPTGLTAGFAQSNSRILRSGLDLPPSAAPRIMPAAPSAMPFVSAPPDLANSAPSTGLFAEIVLPDGQILRARVELPVSAALRAGAATRSAEKNAALLPSEKRSALPGKAAAERNFLVDEKEGVAGDGQNDGITVANGKAVMPSAPFARQLDTANLPPSFAVIERSAAVFAPTSNVEQLQPASVAHRAVAAIMSVAEAQAMSRIQPSPVVHLKLSMGGEDLGVRVELRDGTVSTHFQTASPELRSALAREWSALAAESPDRILRFLEPVYAAGNPGGQNGALGQPGHGSQQHARPAPQDLFGSVGRSYPYGEREADVPARPENPVVPPTSLHLSAVA